MPDNTNPLGMCTGAGPQLTGVQSAPSPVTHRFKTYQWLMIRLDHHVNYGTFHVSLNIQKHHTANTGALMDQKCMHQNTCTYSRPLEGDLGILLGHTQSLIITQSHLTASSGVGERRHLSPPSRSLLSETIPTQTHTHSHTDNISPALFQAIPTDIGGWLTCNCSPGISRERQAK